MIFNVQKKFCFLTKDKTLNKIKYCQKCGSIPLPTYRQIYNQSSIFCRKCYLDQGLSLDLIRNSEPEELDLLRKLIINCKNFEFGCTKQFSFSRLEEMYQHENQCEKSYKKNYSKCKRCHAILKKEIPHDCINYIMNSPILENFKNEIFEQIKGFILEETKQLNEKIIKLEKIIESQNYDQQFLQGYNKNLYNSNNLKVKNFSIQENLLNEEKDEKNNIKNKKYPRPNIIHHIDEAIHNNFQIKDSLINKNPNLDPILKEDIYNDNLIRKSNLEKKFSQKANFKSFKNKITLKDHKEAVNSIIQLEKNIIASGSNDNMIKFWNLNNGKCFETIKAHEDYINSIIKLPNEKLASASHDKKIKIWDLRSYKLLNVLSSHNDYINSIVQLTSGRLASGSGDHTIKIWDMNTLSVQQTLKGHSDWVGSIVQSAENMIITGSGDQIIKLWDLRINESIKNLVGHKNAVKSIILLENNQIASASYDTTILIWDLNSLSYIKKLEGHDDFINTIIKLDDGRIASSSGDKTIKLWDPNSFECTETLNGHEGFILPIIQLDESTIASGSEDKTIKIWSH